MSPFFETIKIEDKKIQNLKYHNLRLNKTIKEIYNKKSDINLLDFINKLNTKPTRCKVIYDKEIKSITYEPYKKRVFNSFKIINSNIKYPYKSTNRDEIEKLFKQKDFCDDILITENKLLKDTSIANIAFYDGLRWLTPKEPLLCGTIRAKLLDEKKIIQRDIRVKDIKNMVSFAIMNSLIGFLEIKNSKFKY